MNNQAKYQEEMVRLDGITKKYGAVTALKKTDLTVRKGEFLTLLGPSGSGKSTILNLIAGMTNPTEGTISIKGKDITSTPPNKRGLGMVFQNYALMPHMTVFENVAFPLRVRKIPKDEVKERVNKALELVQLPEVGSRKPGELSGGQQQRISIARCLVYNPSIILMDEPLGALDKKLREELQLELKDIHHRLGITALYVTHDQEEALTMSDRIILMNGGEIEQLGTPDDLYFEPKTLFAGKFLGDSNTFACAVRDVAGGVVAGMGLTLKTTRLPEGAKEKDKVNLMVRPENASIIGQNDSTSLENRVAARMRDTVTFGGVVKSFLDLGDGSTMIVQELTRHRGDTRQPGEEVDVVWAADDTLVFDEAHS
ncbi:MAG: ABC transporter ATP-binding protein [Pseudomonadota bacterium]